MMYDRLSLMTDLISAEGSIYVHCDWRMVGMLRSIMDEYLTHSFKVIDDDLYTVKIRISPGWARYVEEKIWHESQTIRKLPDKSLEMTP